MTISVIRVKDGMPACLVAATVQVHVPGLNTQACIEMTFPVPAGSNRANWAEIAYERALMMLDPA